MPLARLCKGGPLRTSSPGQKACRGSPLGWQALPGGFGGADVLQRVTGARLDTRREGHRFGDKFTAAGGGEQEPQTSPW